MKTVRTGLFVTAAVLVLTAGTPVAWGWQDGSGWKLPANAAAEQSPIRPTADVLAAGKESFEKYCQRCHGAGGRGDGPDASKVSPPADLTKSMLFALNPDGVMFWKVMNGRTNPRMPGFDSQMSREQVWQVVHYAKTFRKASTAQ